MIIIIIIKTKERGKEKKKYKTRIYLRGGLKKKKEKERNFWIREVGDTKGVVVVLTVKKIIIKNRTKTNKRIVVVLRNG